VTALASIFSRPLRRIRESLRRAFARLAGGPDVPGAPASGASLLIDHARALVTAEEDRVAALQAQATALLTAIGVVLTVASGVAVLFAARQFGKSSGTLSTVAQVAILVLIVMSFGALLTGAAGAIAVLGKAPEPAQAQLLAVLRDQFPTMIDDPVDQTTRTLLVLLSGELKTRQNVSQTIKNRLAPVRALLGGGVVAGVLAVAILVLDTSAGTVDTHLVNATVTVTTTTTP